MMVCVFFVGCTSQPWQELSLVEGVVEQEVIVPAEMSGWIGTWIEATDTEEEVQEAKPEETFPEVLNDDHPNSVRSFIDFPFSGSDFRIEETLTTTTAYTRYRISYLSNGLRISGIMNVPVGEWPFPVLILNHGYIDPAVYTNGRGLKREQDYLAREGYVVVHIDYRNHAYSDKDEEILLRPYLRSFFYGQDAVNVILALLESGLDYIDATRVGMLGHSMGWGVTMHAMLARPDLIDAGVLFAPIHSHERYNFDRRGKNRVNPLQRSIVEQDLGDLIAKATRDAFSAETYADRITAPIILHQGTRDDDVPAKRARQSTDALTAKGVDITLYEYEGEPHEFITARPTVMERTTTFFDTHLQQ